MKQEELLHCLDKLKNSNLLIIVEGIKDKRALNDLNITSVHVLKKALYKEVEELSKNKEVIILTDLDKEGKKLFSRLSTDLQKHGVKINNNFREFLFKSTKLRQIEGLVKYINNCRN